MVNSIGDLTAQRIIGLTGGIATGKTTVSNYLHETYGLPILDADAYARTAMTADLVELIAQRYGSPVLNADRSLNRAMLGKIIFNDAQERTWLESQIHPYVRDRLQAEAQKLYPATVVMSIPLLFEARLEKLVTEIWVVTCTPQQELQRLVTRNHLSVEDAQARIASQLPLADKVNRADVVIDNSGSLEQLYQQIDAYCSGSNIKDS